jgi:hypothetical protein
LASDLSTAVAEPLATPLARPGFGLGRVSEGTDLYRCLGERLCQVDYAEGRLIRDHEGPPPYRLRPHLPRGVVHTRLDLADHWNPSGPPEVVHEAHAGPVVAGGKGLLDAARHSSKFSSSPLSKRTRPFVIRQETGTRS